MPYGTVNADVIQTSTSGGTLGAGNSSAIKNRIINGAMVIDQRNAGASVTQNTSTTYTLDRWAIYGTVTSKFTAQQNAAAVTPPVGFINYLGCTSSSAYSVTSSDIFEVYQAIEGYNIADLGWGTANAKTVTLSFWVRSSLTGTFGGSLTNSGASRTYPFSYTISVANTWEQKSVTIAGDTSGTWLTTNGVGIQTIFSLGMGSTYSGTAGSWSGSLYLAPTGATSVVGTNGATFYITGVQLEVGSSATGFEYRPFGTELALCQRYFYEVTNGGSSDPICMIAGYSTGTGAGVGYGVLSFPVIMRTAPDIYQVTGTNYFKFSGNGTSLTFDSFGYNERSITGITLYNNSSLSASATVGYAYWCRANNANAVLGFSAEL